MFIFKVVYIITSIKSFPSLGPTFPPSNPLNLLDGIVTLSESLTSSPVIEFAVFKKSETEDTLFS